MSSGANIIAEAAIAEMAECMVPSEPRLGHVHLCVADLARATGFYRDVLRFKVVFYGPEVGIPVVFLAASDYHHHIALNTFHSAGGTPPPVGHTGLHHVALAYPDDLSLARAVARVLKCGHEIESARDQGVSLSVYLRDFDGIGIELYDDRPRRPNGSTLRDVRI